MRTKKVKKNEYLSQFLSLSGDSRVDRAGRQIIHVLSFPEGRTGLGYILCQISQLLPLLHRLDQLNSETWEGWQVSLDTLIGKARKLDKEFSGYDSHRNPANPWLYSRPPQALLACLYPIFPEGKERAKYLELRAMLVVLFYDRPANQKGIKELRNYANLIRKESTASYFMRRPSVLEASFWEEFSAEQVIYKEKPRARYRVVGYYDPHAYPTDEFLSYLFYKLWVDRYSDDDSDDGQEKIEEEFDSTILDEQLENDRRVRVAYSSQKENKNRDPEATSPVIVQAAIAPDISEDEIPSSPLVEQRAVRYSNYRTAVDNQRLPMAWNQLNPYELDILVITIRDAICSDCEKTRKALLVIWLTLITGQRLEDIFQWQWMAVAEGVTASGEWLRKMIPPPGAFIAKKYLHDHLLNHVDAVFFQLPKPYPFLLADSIQQADPEIMTVGEFLGIDVWEAEQGVRDFISMNMTKVKHRINLPRIRSALHNSIMITATDKTLAYHIASLPTDIPPSSVYYCSYPEKNLQQLYNESIDKILSGNILKFR